MRLTKLALAAFAALSLGLAAPATAQGHSGGHSSNQWQHEGFFGTFDQNALQRGFRVYREVCSSCHGLKLMSFRNLGQPGGPFFMDTYPNPNDNPKVKAIAAEYLIAGIDPESGDPETFPGKTSDRFPSPYANEPAARAVNGGALPPDLSVITKARHGGADYIFNLLMGFEEPPPGLTVAPGQHYNTHFAGDTAAQWDGDPRQKPPGGFLAMAPPLTADGQVTFDDGTPATREQMARDVATFLAWAGDPKMQSRKQMGVSVIAYLIILAALAYISYRRIWRNVEH